MGEFEDMTAFVRIVEAGGIGRAAEQLGMAKSVVSRRLSDLEGRLGVQLMNRTTRRSSLTEAGQDYYRRALRILADVDELNTDLSHTKTILKGRLKVALPLSFGLMHLAPLILEFAAHHPEVVVDLDFSDRQVDLIEEGFDLAIRIAELRESSLIARKLVPIRTILCASPGYLARAGKPNTPGELKGHSLLHYSNAPGSALKLIAPNGTEVRVPVTARMSANNGDFLREAALAGFGIAVSPNFMAWRDIRAGRLVPLLPGCRFPDLNAYAVYPATRHLPRRARALIDFLAGRLAGEPDWDRVCAGQA